jgi:hypothetical protein
MVMIYPISSVLLLSIISSKSLEDSSSETHQCDRENSRKVRSFINKEILSRLDVAKLSDTCILHPSLDMFERQEQKKEMDGRREWKCSYCGKKFVNEFYLDRHMSNKHDDKLSPNATVCLADLCPIFGCNTNTYARNRDKKDIYSEYKANKFMSMEKCTDSEVEKSRYKCELIARRCFSSDDSAYSTEDFTKQVCDRLNCVGGMLKGAATKSASGKTAREERDSGDLAVLFVVIKVLICFVLIAAVVVNFSPTLCLRILSAVGLAGASEKKRADYTARVGQGRGKSSTVWKFVDRIWRTVRGLPRDKQN